MFRLDKRKIFSLYKYYLSGEIDDKKTKEDFYENNKEKERKLWLVSFLKRRELIDSRISKLLNNGWSLERLPELERATISFAMNELLFNDENFPKVVINQTINFSKSYLGKNKYKYLNKILDTVLKENLNQKK